MKHFGKKIPYKEWMMDSEKELNFFTRFIENSGKRFKVHPSFRVIDKFPVGGYNQRGITYAPDFVVHSTKRAERTAGAPTDTINIDRSAVPLH